MDVAEQVRDLPSQVVAADLVVARQPRGDGLLIEFASVVDAIRCALEVQRGIDTRNVSSPVDKRLEFRIGINVGDVIIEDGDIFGDGVNIAARLEGIAEPGCVVISANAQAASGLLFARSKASRRRGLGVSSVARSRPFAPTSRLAS